MYFLEISDKLNRLTGIGATVKKSKLNVVYIKVVTQDKKWNICYIKSQKQYWALSDYRLYKIEQLLEKFNSKEDLIEFFRKQAKQNIFQIIKQKIVDRL